MVDWEAFYGAFREPDFIPGYEIENHLGGGAFGEVYKARKRSIGKFYAVKFLKLEDGSGSDAIERELEQVRHFASIDHPNLVTIEDMGMVRGVPYLLMGYAGEVTLSRRLKEGNLDREQAIRTFVQVCRGVLALHDRRLAHFDLKPGNVFLKGDVARVGDYGLSRLLTEGRTTLSFGRGTPHYMAPEMLKNRADHRADIYSLGVILYESLAFRVPYDSPSGFGIVVRETDEPPEFPEGFPATLRPVVEKCLRLDPADRYDSVHGILEAMDQTARQGDSVRLRAADLAGAAPPVPAIRDTGVTPRTPGSDVVTMTTLADEGPATPRAASTTYLPRGAGDVPRAETAEPRPAPPAEDPVGTVPVPPAAEGGVMATMTATAVLGAEIMGSILGGPVLIGAKRVGDFVDRLLRGVPGILGSGIRFLFFLLLMAMIGGTIALLFLLAVSLDVG